MWKGEEGSDSSAPAQFRASQLNLIIQIGLKTPIAEAEAVFATAIQFTQKHPGRIIILCPTQNPEQLETLNGKLFSQCYIGESQREMCCCEALILEYSPDDPRSLFNQVSIWLESDLPVYHWFHRIPLKYVKNRHLNFVKNSKRVLFDSQIETDDYSEIPTPDPWRIRDLADARMLPVKQSIGQILSTFEEQAIIKGLTGIKLLCEAEDQANAVQLSKWLHVCLSATEGYSQMELKPGIEIESRTDPQKGIEVIFEYSNDQEFSWAMSKNGNYAYTRAIVGGCSNRHCITLRKNDPETVLAEAIFFGR